MAHFALVAPVGDGHVFPMGSVGAALTRRGHRVTVIAPRGAEAALQRLGVPVEVLDPGEFPRPPAPFWYLLASLAGDHDVLKWLMWNVAVILDLLPPVLERLEVDAVLVDQTVVGGGTASARAGLPFATLCTGLPWNEEAGVPPQFTSWGYRPGWTGRLRNQIGYASLRVYFRPLLELLNQRRRAWGLAPYRSVNDDGSTLAEIAQLCPELDFPRAALPEFFHYVGSLSTQRSLSSDHEFPFERLDGRPLAYVSLGTTQVASNRSALRRIVEAFGGMDVQLVLSLGSSCETDGPDSLGLGIFPGNAIVVGFAPQLALLERAAVMVTHGGVNSTLEALRNGVPLVVLPRSADQFAVGARVAYAGAGLVGSLRRGRPAWIRSLVARVLDEPAFRRCATEIQESLARQGGEDRAAEIAERALLEGRPVLRDGLAGADSDPANGWSE